MDRQYFTKQDFEAWLEKAVRDDAARRNRGILSSDGTLHGAIEEIYQGMYIKRLCQDLGHLKRLFNTYSVTSENRVSSGVKQVNKMEQELRARFYKGDKKLIKSKQRYTNVQERAKVMVELSKVFSEISKDIQWAQQDVVKQNNSGISTHTLRRTAEDIDILQHLAEIMNDTMFHLNDEQFEKFMNNMFLEDNPIANIDQLTINKRLAELKR